MTIEARRYCWLVVILAVCGTRTSAGPQLSPEAQAAIYAGGLLPDMQQQVPYHLNIQNEHQQEMLRFSSTLWNLGAGRLQIRGGGQVAPCVLEGVAYDQCTHATQEILNAAGDVVTTNPAGVAFFHPQHNHWHQNDVSDFILRSGSIDGPIVASGVKVTFCLIDYDHSFLVPQLNARSYFGCNADLQGVSPGFGDSYHHSTEGQELDITGMPEGLYYLSHFADPTNHWIELDDTNNGAWVSFMLSRKGANPELTLVGHSTCNLVTCGNSSNK